MHGGTGGFLSRRDSLPALVRAGLVPAQFETIRPFFDGNGRVGRQLIALSLCALRLHERLFETPIVGVQQACELLDLGFSAANRLIDRLVERGVLVEVTGNARNRRFAYHRYIELFDD